VIGISIPGVRRKSILRITREHDNELAPRVGTLAWLNQHDSHRVPAVIAHDAGTDRTYHPEGQLCYHRHHRIFSWPKRVTYLSAHPATPSLHEFLGDSFARHPEFSLLRSPPDEFDASISRQLARAASILVTHPSIEASPIVLWHRDFAPRNLKVDSGSDGI
jgi:hypothetical protein